MRTAEKQDRAEELLVATYDVMVVCGFFDNLPLDQLTEPQAKVDYMIVASEECRSKKEAHDGMTWALPPHLMLVRIADLVAGAIGAAEGYQRVVAEQSSKLIDAMITPGKRVAYLTPDEWEKRASFARWILMLAPEAYLKQELTN